MSETHTEIATLGEFGLIEHLTKNNVAKRRETVVSIGDDAAVLNFNGLQTVVTTDMLVEGIHFDLTYTPLKALGYKAVAANLSDVYAMFAMPTQITLGIAISNRFSVELLEDFYAGVYEACERYSVDLVGGDTTSSQKGFVISITALGSAEANKIVRRKGAQKNDLICVSGDLGGAYLGLQLLEREKKIFLESPGVQPDFENKRYIINRILKPEPRRDIVEWLNEQNIVPTSMIDVSDGLSSELLHICRQSKKGCVIYEEKLPIHAQTRETAFAFNLDPTACALSGGEDYELLFTIAQEDYEKIVLNEQISVVGYITDDSEMPALLTRQGSRHALTAQGWNAFQKK